MTKATHKEVTVKTYVEKINKLLPNENNPRKINKTEYEKLKKSLKEFPEMKQLREIIVDENLQILGGHQRIFALLDLGYEDVTVKQVVGLTDSQKREFMIKDNTASGYWDTDMLANIFEVEELKNWGVPDFGSIGENQPKEKPEKEQPTGGSRELECPACGHIWDPSQE